MSRESFFQELNILKLQLIITLIPQTVAMLNIIYYIKSTWNKDFYEKYLSILDIDENLCGRIKVFLQYIDIYAQFGVRNIINDMRFNVLPECHHCQLYAWKEYGHQDQR